MHSYAKRFRYFAVMALSFCAHNAFAQWEQITPENEVVVSVPGGGRKNRFPSCSLPALPGPEGLAPNPFSFYSNKEKVITYLSTSMVAAPAGTVPLA